MPGKLDGFLFALADIRGGREQCVRDGLMLLPWRTSSSALESEHSPGLEQTCMELGVPRGSWHSACLLFNTFKNLEEFAKLTACLKSGGGGKRQRR